MESTLSAVGVAWRALSASMTVSLYAPLLKWIWDRAAWRPGFCGWAFMEVSMIWRAFSVSALSRYALAAMMATSGLVGASLSRGSMMENVLAASPSARISPARISRAEAALWSCSMAF